MMEFNFDPIKKEANQYKGNERKKEIKGSKFTNEFKNRISNRNDKENKINFKRKEKVLKRTNKSDHVKVSRNDIKNKEDIVDVKKTEQDILELISEYTGVEVEQLIERYALENGITLEELKEILVNEFGLENEVDIIALEGSKELLSEFSKLLEVKTEAENKIDINSDKIVKDIEISNRGPEIKGMENNVKEIASISIKNNESIDNEIGSKDIENMEVEIPLLDTENNNGSNKGSESDKRKDLESKHNVVEKSGTVLKEEVEISILDNVKIDDETIKTTKTNNITKSMYTLLEEKNVMTQVIEKIDLVIKNEYSEMKINLTPKELGDITLKIITQNGIVSAEFVAESQKVKEMIESNFSDLSDTLKSKGLEISELSVSVESENKKHMDNFFKEKNKSVKRIMSIIKEIEEEVEEREYLDGDEIVKSNIEYRV